MVALLGRNDLEELPDHYDREEQPEDGKCDFAETSKRYLWGQFYNAVHHPRTRTNRFHPQESTNQHMIYLTVIYIWLAVSNAANIPMPNIRSNRVSNSINSVDESPYIIMNDWIEVSQAPPKIVNQPMGARVELECEVVGSPTPTIQWIKGTNALTDNESYESNMISEKANGIAKLKSRLVISSLLPVHQGVFTCIGTSGSKTTTATTNLYVSQGKLSMQRNFSDYLNTNMISLGEPIARIVLFNTVVMEPIGADIILPCKTIGTPKPDVFWINTNNDQVISNQDARFKVLPDGELRIQDLAWPDMGAYTCVARNDYSKDSITTFVYPFLNSK